MLMKRVGFLLALIGMLSFTGCGTAAGARDTKETAGEISQPDAGEKTVSVNLDDVITQGDPSEQYCDYLAQTTENMFAEEDGIGSADAAVSYDEDTEQYSIELSLCTNGEVDDGQMEDYKTYLSKNYGDVILLIDGQEYE